VKAVNLIPAEQRAGGGSLAGESNGGAYFVIVLIAGIAVLALMYGVARHQVESRRSEAASLTAQAQATQARATQLAPYVSFKSMYQSRLQAVWQLASTRFDWAHVLHELGRVLPRDAALTSMKGAIGAAGASPASTPPPAAAAAAAAAGSVTSATPAGAVPAITLAGCATSQSEVAQTLVRLRLIDGVSNVILQSSTKSGTGGGGGAGTGSCPNGDAAFALQIAFSPLPTPSAPPSSSSTASAAASSASAPSTANAGTGGGAQ
jgi:Tfp pilus assembly protein PilN